MARTLAEPPAASATPVGAGAASALVDLDAAWATPTSGPRLRAVRVAAESLRHRLAAGPRAVSVRTLPLVVVPYPTKFAFFGAALSVAPYVMLTHRCVLVQFLQAGALKTLLFNPTDVTAARATPFFARLAGHLPAKVKALIAQETEPLEDQLHRHGLRPIDIDYVGFDHLHAQDLRPLLATTPEGGARFPNATLIVPKVEWDEWSDPHPLERAWFVRDGRHGVSPLRVAFTTGDLMLGDGVMLLRTPGHTQGNQTLFVNTSSGVWGISGNGVAADSWSPFDSKIAGLRALCKRQDLDIVINANTPVRGADQYTSMVLEKAVADRLKRAPAFAQMFPSSEVTPSLFSPGLKPTVLHRAVTHGEVALPAASAAGRGGQSGSGGVGEANGATGEASREGVHEAHLQTRPRVPRSVRASIAGARRPPAAD